MGKTDVAPTSQTVKSWLVLIDRQHRLLTDISTVRGEQMSIPVCLSPAGLTAPKTDRRGKGEARGKSLSAGTNPPPPRNPATPPARFGRLALGHFWRVACDKHHQHPLGDSEKCTFSQVHLRSAMNHSQYFNKTQGGLVDLT